MPSKPARQFGYSDMKFTFTQSFLNPSTFIVHLETETYLEFQHIAFMDDYGTLVQLDMAKFSIVTYQDAI